MPMTNYGIELAWLMFHNTMKMIIITGLNAILLIWSRVPGSCNILITLRLQQRERKKNYDKLANDLTILYRVESILKNVPKLAQKFQLPAEIHWRSVQLVKLTFEDVVDIMATYANVVVTITICNLQSGCQDEAVHLVYK